ncbi:MAG: class I SAM-dependent methyltransferase [Patescibacteria group bacterium]
MDSQTQKNLLNLVKKNYDEVAEEFDKSRNRNLEPLWSELIKICENAKDGHRILDVGCGNGRLLKAFKNKKIYYLGVDNSEEIIKIAKAKYPKNKFVSGDISDLGQIPEINFNYVFAVAVLHHIPGKKLRLKALKQLKNKINKNGKIIITAWNMWPHKRFRKLIFKFALLKLIKKNPRLGGTGKMDFGDIIFDGFNKISQRYYHAFTKFGLWRLSKKAGLKVERIYKDKFNYYAILKK